MNARFQLVWNRALPFTDDHLVAAFHFRRSFSLNEPC
jgi:hypothetical protein